MSLEAWAALGQIGTFVVIAATAAAALIQLRHLRAANNMAAASMFIQEFEGTELRDAFAFVRTQLKQRLEVPEFREEIRDFTQDRSKHPEIAVCNFFDLWADTIVRERSTALGSCDTTPVSYSVFGSCSSRSWRSRPHEME